MVVIRLFFVTSQRIIFKLPPELTRDGPIGGFVVKLQNNIYIENQLFSYFLNSPIHVEHSKPVHLLSYKR